MQSRTNENYCSYASRSLTNYVSYEAKEGIDTQKAFTLAVKMANNKTLKSYYRSNFIYAIEAYGGSEGENALAKLANSNDKDLADPAKQALQRLKDKLL